MTGEDRRTDRPALGRREFLGKSLVFAAVASMPPLIAPATAHAIPIAASTRRLSLVNINTLERFDAPYWADGSYIPEAIRRLNVLLRDHRANKVARFDVALFDDLWRVHRELDTDEPFQVVCGYRCRATNASSRRQHRGVARDSFHTRAMAIDVRMADRTVPAIAGAALDAGAGGVGTYLRSGFVHIDTGPRRTW